MAGRNAKQTVDYFPHYCKHGRTLFILEQRYKARGYALWFKILEELGASDGHFIDLGSAEEMEYLAARTYFPAEEMTEALDLLAKMGSIDSDLWKKKIIWSDNFIENIKDVYRKRTISVPDKPISDDGNAKEGDGIQQSKVKESKDIRDSVPNNKKSMYEEPTIEVGEDGEYHEVVGKPTSFGKYTRKVAERYALCHDIVVTGQTMKGAKDLLVHVQKEYPNDTIGQLYTEAITAIDLCKEYYQKQKYTGKWGITKVIENWNKII